MDLSEQARIHIVKKRPGIQKAVELLQTTLKKLAYAIEGECVTSEVTCHTD
jgi:hypothetical protein